MNRRLFMGITLFAIFVSSMFIVYNPNIATEFSDDYTQGEVFLPKNHTFEFKTFSINSSAKNFTAKIITPGHIMLVDDTGDTTINVVELNNMINSQRDQIKQVMDNELKKTSWTIDGVAVHQIDFVLYSPLYSAYCKNSTTNTIIYLSSPNEQETADMMNSLTFRD
jgi:hypothetical protein